MQRLDVAVLGGGVAGLTAAYLLRDRELEVFDSASHVGGRTRSLQQPDGIWLNTGAQYVSTDRVKVVELADAVGARLITDDNLEEYWRGLYPPDPDERSEIESVIERITSEQMHRRPATLPELDDQPFDHWLGDVSPSTHRFYDRWCQIMNSGSSVEISLYGALWLWGDQRSTPWIDKPVPRHDHGDCVFDGRGGCFHNIVGDPTCRVVWDDPDDTIKTGTLLELYRQKPQFRDRVVRVEVQRWLHGMPLYSVGRMKTYDQLAEPVGGIFFCGDYTWASNMEGAALSGERAAAQVQRASA